MKVIHSLSFTGARAWEALDIAQFNDTSVRLHWTDQPYVWHINDGDEVFVVLDGQIQMDYCADGRKHHILNPGDICFLKEGEEHVATPLGGPARILVIEKKGSV